MIFFPKSCITKIYIQRRNLLFLC